MEEDGRSLTRKTAQGNGTALDAGFCQGIGSSRIGKFARIVVLTQVTKENIAKSLVTETAYSLCTFVVAQVSAALNNTHFQLIGVRTAHKHPHIIIRLNHDCVRLACIAEGLISHPADVCHYGKRVRPGTDMVADCLCSIMWHDKALYSERTNFKNLWNL